MNIWIIVALVVLIATFVWVGVEIALTLRKVRGKVDGLVDKVDGTVDELQGTIRNVDKTVADLNPAIQEVKPLLGKVETTVDALSLDLLQVNTILSDVGTVTGAASDATTAVSGVVGKAAAVAGKAVSKLTGKGGGQEAQPLPEAEAAAIDAAAPEVETVSDDSGYFTYPASAPTDSDNE